MKNKNLEYRMHNIECRIKVKDNNANHKFYQQAANKAAFTLVELIVTIVILAILGTIAFISFQGYSKNSRDSVRIADINSTKKSLEIFITKAGFYPTPDNGTNIIYSGATVWTEGTIGENVIKNIQSVSKVITDPLTSNEYTYSITSSKKEYQIGAISEGGGLTQSITNNTYATDLSKSRAVAYITGNYNEKFTKVNTGAISWILAQPSIIVSDIGNPDLGNILSNKKLTYNNYGNYPHSYNQNSTGGFDYNKPTQIIYSGSLLDLHDVNSNKLEFITNLQDAYSGTVLATNPIYEEIMGADPINDSTGAINVVNTYIISNKGGIKLKEVTLIGDNSTGGGGFKWRSIFDNTYFAPYGSESWDTQWGGSSSGWIAGLYSYNVHLVPIGTWKTGFRPTKIRITHNDNTPGVIQITDSNFNRIVYKSNYVSGEEINLDFSENLDMVNWNLDSMNYPQRVTNIEFYTDANIGVESTTTTTTSGESGGGTDDYASCTGTGQFKTATSTYGSCSQADIVICSGAGTGYTLAACNVGSSVAGTGSSSYGGLYQFGKSDTSWVAGQVGYSYDWKSPGGTDAGSANDWGVVEANKTTATWGNSDITSRTKMQGPCTSGYHIPTNAEWKKIHLAGGWADTGEATNMINQLLIPKAGTINWHDGGNAYIGSFAYLWSSSTSLDRAYSLLLEYNYGTSFIRDTYTGVGRANSLSIRCLKN